MSRAGRSTRQGRRRGNASSYRSMIDVEVIDVSPALSSMLVDPGDTRVPGSPASQNDLLDVLLALVTGVFEYLVVFLFVAVDGIGHLPRAGKDRRVFERDLVVDAIGADQRPAFHDVQRVAMEASMRVDPRPVVEVGDVDNQRVAFPAST